MPKKAKKKVDTTAYPPARALTEKDPRYSSVRGFRCALTSPQQATLYAMLKMEQDKKMAKGTTAAAFLTNPVGSGKTASLLALITEQPVPPPPYLIPTAIADHGYRVGCFITYEIKYKATVIFVNRDLILQWQQEINKFNPNLSCFVIRDLASLEEFQSRLYSDISKFDIILVKNGDVSRPLKVGNTETGEIPCDKYLSQRSIICNFGRITRDICFARVIFDDFDTAKLPRIIPQIGALFTWFVSATKKEKRITKTASVYDDTKSIEWHCENPNIVYSHILGDREWMDNVSIFVDEEWQNSCTTVGAPVFFIHRYINQNKKIVNAIGLIAGDKISEVMQALNSDFPAGAAKAAGIEAETHSEFLAKLLKKRSEEFKVAQVALANVAAYRLQAPSLLPADENPDAKDTFNQHHVLAGRKIIFKYPNFTTVLRDVEEKYSPIVKSVGDMLKTFTANITDNKCKICIRELLAKTKVDEDEDRKYMMELGIAVDEIKSTDMEVMDKICAIPCCPQSLYHYSCALKGCKFVKDGRMIVGRCPTAKHPIDFGALTVIEPSKLASGTIPENIAAIFEEKTPRENTAASSAKTSKPKELRTKLDGIIDIIYGIQSEEQKTADMSFKKIMIGTRPLGDPYYINCMKALVNTGLTVPNAYRIMKALKLAPRVLIFASYDDTLLRMCEEFARLDLKYSRLIGTISELNRTITNFANGDIDVLVVNSITNCSGLNLQFATDLVFAHKIIDISIETQVLGRIQREGRTSNARIHYMLYDTE